MSAESSITSIAGVTSNGIAYERRGRGRPVVLLHGWCLNSTMWIYAQDALCPVHEVITIDLAGFGKSAGLAGPYSIARHADDLAQVLSELGLRDVVLAGFAFGAAVALELASRCDPNVAAVVSVGIPDAGSSPYEKMPKSMRRDWPDFARRSAQALFHTPQSEATLAWLERIFGSASLLVALETVGVLAAYDPFDALAKVRIPVVFVHGDLDSVAPVEFGQKCAALMPNARVEVIGDCGHLIVLDQKTRFHEVVLRFIASV